jgi:preprotein translocase subunit YajC
VDNPISAFLPIVILVLAFWLLVVRPSKARHRQFQDLQGSLAPGQQVMLASGLYGTLVTLGDETAELQIAPGTVVTVNRNAVASVVDPATSGPSES